MSDLAIRRRPVTRVEASEEGEGIVTAYVSVYDVEYKVGPFGQREIIEPGAFDASIADKPTVPFFWSHNWPFGLMIGDAALSSDDHGLIAKATLDMDDELGRRVFRRIKSGAVDDYSVGYIPHAFKIDEDDEDLERVTEARCIEASAVVLGANPETETIDVRNRQLLAPVLVAAEGGALEVQWVPAKPPVTVIQSDGAAQLPIVVNVTVATGANPGEPAKDDEVDASSLLREPAFRELVRERLSSPDLPSMT